MTVPGETGCPDGAAVPDLDVAWMHGSKAAKDTTDPDIQVHACDEHTCILRQNMAVSYAAPFMSLLSGASRAVLPGTGATANPEFFPLRRTADSIMADWLAGHPHPDDYGLLVLHAHPHADHTAAGGQFAGRPGTVVTGAEREAAWPYPGFAGYPGPAAGADLGGRVPDGLATPGHHPAAVTYHDRYSGILFTGGTVYPGRLHVLDRTAYVRSIGRLAGWCAQRPVTYLIGCHIEMTATPGVDDPAGWSYQPDEPPLQLTADHLAQIRDTLTSHDFKRNRYVLPQVIITPVG